MCIAVYVPSNIEIPEATLRSCFTNNPDGAGLMYTDGERVYIEKGFMKIDEFVKAFQAIPSHFERSFHCRIATSGKIEEGCCHPFPIIPDMKDMKKTKHVCQGGVAHNGIISWATPTKGRAEWYSDTMNFTSQILSPLFDKIHDVAFHELIERSTTGNKFIIMTADKVHLIGAFNQEGGIFYSNTSFRKTVYVYNDYSNEGNFTGTGRGGERENKHSRKSKAIKRLKDSSLSEAYWIIVDTKEKGKLSTIANSLTLMGINVIEEDEVLIGGNESYLYLVDRLPSPNYVYGYPWKVLSKKGVR